MRTSMATTDGDESLNTVKPRVGKSTPNLHQHSAWLIIVFVQNKEPEAPTSSAPACHSKPYFLVVGQLKSLHLQN